MDPEEMIVNGIRESIISNDLFHKVQDLLDGKSKPKNKLTRLNQLFPLRGHLICPTCGRILTASSSRGNGFCTYLLLMSLMSIIFFKALMKTNLINSNRDNIIHTSFFVNFLFFFFKKTLPIAI